jgi:hypothetical protein
VSRPGSLLAAFVAHELRIQSRALRWRAVAGLCAGGAALPALVVFLYRGGAPTSGASYLQAVMPALVTLSIAGSFLVACDALLREREQETWSTLSLCRLGSSRYVLYRWLALLPALGLISVLPLLAAGGLAIAAGETFPSAAAAGVWVVWVLPRVLLWSALGLGFGTAGGGLFGGAGLAAATAGVGLAALDAVLFRFRLHVAAPPLGTGTLGRQLAYLLFAREESSGMPFPPPASDAPIDLRVEAERSLAPLGSTAALAALGLAAAILLLRRTRPDLRPWRVGERHPLRTFVVIAARWRDRFAPDDGLSRADRIAVAALLAGALLAAGAAVVRDARMVAAAEARFTLEGEPWPPPTDRGVLASTCTLTGRVDSRGQLRVLSRTELRHDGERLQGELSMLLGRGARLEALASPGRSVRFARRGDRLAVRLVPPLAPGDRATLTALVSGRPARTVFALPWSREYGAFIGFQRSFARYRNARFARELPDLAPSFTVRALSPTRVRLAASDLLPVLRYTPHELVGGDRYDGPFPRLEEVRPPVRLAVSLDVPSDLFLADACGDVTSGGRLAGGCTLPLAAFTVRGGAQQATREGGLTVALFPGHGELALAKLGPLDQLRELVREIWPEEDLADSTVVLEVPDEANFLPGGQLLALRRLDAFLGAEVEVEGRLLLVPEMLLLAGDPLAPGDLAARLVGNRLLARRRVVAEQERLFDALITGLAAGRAGYGPPEGAVVPPAQEGPGSYRRSLLEAEADERNVWQRRLPALLVDLGHRVGEDALRRGLAAFLARTDAPPGTLLELVADWQRASGVPLDDFYRSYLAGTALPWLDLADVSFARAPEGWRVRGRVVNRGSGEARCDVVLTSELARGSVGVVVPPEGSASFELASRSRPRAVLLDPEGRCHRYRSLAPIERVDYGERAAESERSSGEAGGNGDAAHG